MKPGLLVAGVLLIGFAGAPVSAADLPPGIASAARCSPRASAEPEPANALRIIGSQDTVPRTLFGAKDLVVIAAGTTHGVALNQLFVIRHHEAFATPRAGLRPVGTSGWLRIVAATEKTSIGRVEFSCTGIFSGDYLEPYFEPVLPASMAHADTSGELDFSTSASILFGENSRLTGGVGDFLVIDAGLGRGAEPGSRYAIFRDLKASESGLPLAPIGEAVVVHADANSAVVRVTLSRDVIQRGDLLIPRRSR